MVRKFIFAAAVFVVALVALEGVARLAEYALRPDESSQVDQGWQTRFFGQLFDWHEPDPLLLWRFKANLDNALITTNRQHLIGDAVGPKREGMLRVLVLGDSSPVGIGLESYRQNFPSVLQRQLAITFDDSRPVDVINAAVSGYTSEQIRLFLSERGWQYEPDYVVLYCGNNDASISGTVSDKQILEAQRFVKLRQGLSHFALYRLLRAALAGTGREGKETKSNLVVRVDPGRYAENIGAIAEECDAHQCRLIICKPPVPRLWPAALQFKVFYRSRDAEGEVLLPPLMRSLYDRDIHYCVSQQRFAALYGDGDLFTRAVYSSALTDNYDPVEARETYQQAVATDSSDAYLWNNLGVAFWLLGYSDSALTALQTARADYEAYPPVDSGLLRMTGSTPLLYNLGITLMSAKNSTEPITVVDTSVPGYAQLDSALQRDYFSLRIKRPYLEAIDRMAEDPNVQVVDLPEVFAAGGGERLFIDHCHPTAAGHRLIARALYRVIVEDQSLTP